MTTVKLLADEEMDPRAKAVIDDVRKTFKSDEVGAFFRALAYFPESLEAAWGRIKTLMDPSAPDHKLKHQLALAVCASSGSSYFSNYHAKFLRQEGASEEEIAEVLAVVELWSGLCAMVHGLDLETPSGNR